jgi:hypothetical protein
MQIRVGEAFPSCTQQGSARLLNALFACSEFVHDVLVKRRFRAEFVETPFGVGSTSGQIDLDAG